MTTTSTRRDEAKAPTKSRIPTFRSVEEAAEFWDTHDSGEFEDEFEEVTDVKIVAMQTKDELMLRLDGEILAALIKRAQELNITPATLARRWILEHIHQR